MELENSLVLHFSEESTKTIYWASLSPDMMKSMKRERATMEMLQNSSSIEFKIYAKDPTAMRAAVNSILQAIKIVEDTMKLAE